MAIRRKRTNFSPLQKAEIYVRDHATCAFSGKSLWLLDFGLGPLGDHDWVDHSTPCARGGKSDILNGVCASYTYNSKKGANGRDKQYLFREGRPTEDYYDFYGPLPPPLRKQLKRRFFVSDWFFNRCVALSLETLGERHYRSPPGTVRQVRFCQKAAWRALCQFQRRSVGAPSFEERGLVTYPSDPGTKALLRLRTIRTESRFYAALRAMDDCYSLNHDLHNEFYGAKTRPEREQLLRRAEKVSRCHPLTIETLRSHHRFLLETETA